MKEIQSYETALTLSYVNQSSLATDFSWLFSLMYHRTHSSPDKCVLFDNQHIQIAWINRDIQTKFVDGYITMHGAPLSTLSRHYSLQRLERLVLFRPEITRRNGVHVPRM